MCKVRKAAKKNIFSMVVPKSKVLAIKKKMPFFGFREAAKKVLLSMAGPLRGGGGGKRPAIKKKKRFFLNF